MTQGLETCAVFGIIAYAMAKLDVLSKQPEKIVLGKGGSKGLGNLIGLLISAVVVCVGLSSFFEDGGTTNPVVIVIGLIVAVSLLGGALSALRSARVTIDAQQRLATREDSLAFFPLRRQEMALNSIRDVQVSSPRRMASRMGNSLPVWQVELRAADGTTLLVNERATYAEMRALADDVSTILDRPVRDAAGEAPAAPAPGPSRPTAESPYRRTSARQARQQAAAGAPVIAASARQAKQQAEAQAPVLGASTRQASEQSAADAAILQTTAMMSAEGVAASAPIFQATALQAYEQTVASAPIAETTARQTQAQVSANMPVFDMGMRMAFSQMSAFESDAAIRAQMANASAQAGVPFAQSSARLAQQQSEATYTIEYALPPVTGMAQLPTAALFPPMMDLPALAPMVLDAVVSSVGSMMLPETRPDIQASTADTSAVVENESQSESDDPGELFRQAHRMQEQGNFADARAVYERALDSDPGSATIHNDLGVLYYQQKKFADAERAFRKTIALDPFYAPGRYNLGVTLQREGNRKGALEQFRLGASHAVGYAQDFQNALQGNVHAPILSA